MNINFHITAERVKELTWDDLETIELMEQGEFPVRGTRTLLMRFMADEQNNYLPETEAARILKSLKYDDIVNTVQAFGTAFRDYTLPKAKGNK